jgi:hypothetical protein
MSSSHASPPIKTQKKEDKKEKELEASSSGLQILCGPRLAIGLKVD